jgi:hypothetical protein
MSLSPNVISSVPRVSQPYATQESFVFPVVLVCIALALILISAVFSPVTLETPGIESLMVGP